MKLCPSVSRSCPKFVTCLFIFTYLVLLLFVTNPVLNAASVRFVTTSSVAVTDLSSINTLPAYAVYCLLLKIIPLGLVSVFFIIFSNTIFFFHGATAPSEPGPSHYSGFMITLRHTTLGRTPLD